MAITFVRHEHVEHLWDLMERSIYIQDLAPIITRDLYTTTKMV